VPENCQPPGKSGREINSYLRSVKKNITCLPFFFGISTRREISTKTKAE
jgi:hypothetical protein